MRTGIKVTQRTKSIIKKSIVFGGLLSLSLAGSFIYRPWIYKNHYFDFHLADSFTSLFSVPVLVSLYDLVYTIIRRPQNRKLLVVAYSTIGFFIYELLELFGKGFDFYDCIALFIGGLLTLLFYHPLDASHSL